MSGASNVSWNPHSDMCSPLMSSSSTQRHITSLFLQRWRTETERSAEAHQGENNKQHFTPHHLFPSFLSSCFPQAHLHSSHLFFPRLLPGNRQEEHHLETSKPQEELAGRRRITQMFHGGTTVRSMRTLKTPQFLLCFYSVGQSSWLKWRKNII